mmetsp:Transcript_30494/g.66802  ORF Transcript_30494/g.66802 Transcript_30494/m.66802 type:complete len:90 (-) Transcript_30494:200-469(-)
MRPTSGRVKKPVYPFCLRQKNARPLLGVIYSHDSSQRQTGSGAAKAPHLLWMSLHYVKEILTTQGQNFSVCEALDREPLPEALKRHYHI